ncbi:hypothetical protein MW887_002809 [Aspergillus wentii]|nr:hypothetical protein MW887_002809 [Aspergillus wentii]
MSGDNKTYLSNGQVLGNSRFSGVRKCLCLSGPLLREPLFGTLHCFHPSIWYNQGRKLHIQPRCDATLRKFEAIHTLPQRLDTSILFAAELWLTSSSSSLIHTPLPRTRNSTSPIQETDPARGHDGEAVVPALEAAAVEEVVLVLGELDGLMMFEGRNVAVVVEDANG